MPTSSREKQLKYNKDSYYRNQAKRIELVRSRKLEIIAWFIALRTALKCSRCDENHPACLEFHHRNPEEKVTEVSTMVYTGSGKEKILKEINKCDVLCANCHKKEHYNAGVA
jgi:uncharacterized lipoprotein YddW (UPF0748 family)